MRKNLVAFLALVAAVALLAGYAAQSRGADQVAPSTQPTTRPIARDDVAGLFKPGRYKGAWVVPGMSARYARLHNAMVRGITENRDWYQAAARSATPGQPMPYDPRLGVTKEEYRDYLAWGKDLDSSDLRMDVGSGFEVEIVRAADGSYRFVGGPELLSTLSIDQGLTASSPCGSADPRTMTTTPTRLRTLGNASPMLEWKGVSGSLDAGSYRSARLSVGVLERDGSLWIDYQGLRQGNVLPARNDRLILLIYINGAPPATQPTLTIGPMDPTTDN